MSERNQHTLTDSQVSKLIIKRSEWNSTSSSDRRIPYAEWYLGSTGALETPAQRIQRDASDPQLIIQPESGP